MRFLDLVWILTFTDLYSLAQLSAWKKWTVGPNCSGTNLPRTVVDHVFVDYWTENGDSWITGYLPIKNKLSCYNFGLDRNLGIPDINPQKTQICCIFGGRWGSV